MKVYLRAHRKGDGFIGKFIAWFSFGDYKHISLVFEHDDGTLDGFQSNGKRGVHFFEVGAIGDKGVDVFEIPVTDMQARDMYFLASTKDGDKYDWKGIWGFVRRAKREDSSRWFCSEMASWLCQEVGLPLQRMAPWSINPVVCAASMILEPRPDL